MFFIILLLYVKISSGVSMLFVFCLTYKSSTTPYFSLKNACSSLWVLESYLSRFIHMMVSGCIPGGLS